MVIVRVSLLFPHAHALTRAQPRVPMRVCTQTWHTCNINSHIICSEPGSEGPNSDGPGSDLNHQAVSDDPGREEWLHIIKYQSDIWMYEAGWVGVKCLVVGHAISRVEHGGDPLSGACC